MIKRKTLARQIGWVKRSETHQFIVGDGFRYAAPILLAYSHSLVPAMCFYLYLEFSITSSNYLTIFYI